MRWLTPLAAALIYAAAISPSLSQRVPRFLLPTLAAIGAILITAALVRSLVRIVDAGPAKCRLVLPVALNTVATLVLVVSPVSRLVSSARSANGPRTLARFGDWRGSEGYPRLEPHRGVDIAARPGSDVLAAADGRVVVARDNGDACGRIVAIAHDPHGYRTVYCHLEALTVAPGEHVSRGERIGTVGTTGQRAWPGYEHVHLEVQRGTDPNNLEDPAARLVGCFDGSTAYPAEGLVLTYPVRC
jgi:murein DD-endopeptidase MepM/ murein hydrolase activator NlpD